ncbi:MAG: DUF4139 domain-containing protein [Rhodobacteraceae bacterium]|nr:DUF4139 domain-containing protein [Paracoccaceae bacterium]
MLRLLPLCLALAPAVGLADDIPLVSEVSAVTLYPNGASIIRDVPFSMPAGAHQLILTDLPRTTPLASVRVAVEGAVMGSVSARTDFVPPRTEEDSAALEAARAEVERLEAAMREARAQIEAIRLEAEAAEARVAFLDKLGEGEGVAQMDVAALRDLVGMIGEETLAALQTAHDAQRRADTADRDLKDLREELDRARKALAALVPERADRAMLAVAVSADAATEGQLTVTYNTGDAGWTPVYDLRLDRAGETLRIARGAFVAQTTGENWSDVAMTLSTVRPSEQTSPSDIWPWLRRIFDPEDLQTKTLMREQMEDDSFAGALAEPAIEAPVMVEEAQASFDGLAVTYTYPGTVSVASGADRVRLALGELETDVDLVAQAVPISDPTAFLMASVTNDTGELILPTPEASFYLDGRFIGQQYLDLIPAGGEADLSFGPIDGLRLTRTVLDRNEGDRGVITRSNELTEEVRIEVENLTGETWPLRVLDRVPFSEQEDLEIEWQAQPRPTEQDVDGKRGVLVWTFDLAPGQTQQIALSHSLEWPEGMRLR